MEYGQSFVLGLGDGRKGTHWIEVELLVVNLQSAVKSSVDTR